MNRRLVRTTFSVSSLLVAACSGPANVTVKVTPEQANVLTCSKLGLSALVTGTTNMGVNWSVSPASSGTVDGLGQYTSPIQTPNPAGVTVTATSQVDPSASSSAALELATAFPKGPSNVGLTRASLGLYTHWVVAQGQRAYAVAPLQTNGSATAQIQIARSDDGGTSFATPTTAITTTMDAVNDSTSYIDCTSVAIDAGNPDVVYLYGRISGSNALAKTVGTDGGITTLAFAVSTNGGGSFQTSVLRVVGQSGVGLCGDVISPAPGKVVIEAPGAYGCDGNPDMYVWSDANQGAGLASGTGDQFSWLANGDTHALDDVNNGANCEHLGIGQNGGSDASGATSESPRLFTDASGHVCVTYVGELSSSGNPSQINTYVQCSNDLGQSFSPPAKVDPATAAGVDHEQAAGTFGPNGRAAIVWNQGGLDAGANLYVAISQDGGGSFGSPIAVPTYVLPGETSGAPTKSPSIAYDASGVLWVAYQAYDGGSKNRVIVDKSCDDGKTWSGAVLVNGPEGSITDMSVPWFVLATGAAPRLALTTDANDGLAVFTLAP